MFYQGSGDPVLSCSLVFLFRTGPSADTVLSSTRLFASHALHSLSLFWALTLWFPLSGMLYPLPQFIYCQTLSLRNLGSLGYTPEMHSSPSLYGALHLRFHFICSWWLFFRCLSSLVDYFSIKEGNVCLVHSKSLPRMTFNTLCGPVPSCPLHWPWGSVLHHLFPHSPPPLPELLLFPKQTRYLLPQVFILADLSAWAPSSFFSDLSVFWPNTSRTSGARPNGRSAGLPWFRSCSASAFCWIILLSTDK